MGLGRDKAALGGVLPRQDQTDDGTLARWGLWEAPTRVDALQDPLLHRDVGETWPPDGPPLSKVWGPMSTLHKDGHDMGGYRPRSLVPARSWCNADPLTRKAIGCSPLSPR